jgi:hypothetical protein
MICINSQRADQDCYELEAGCFTDYGFEYKPGKLLLSFSHAFVTHRLISGFDDAVRFIVRLLLVFFLFDSHNPIPVYNLDIRRPIRLDSISVRGQSGSNRRNIGATNSTGAYGTTLHLPQCVMRTHFVFLSVYHRQPRNVREFWRCRSRTSDIPNENEGGLDSSISTSRRHQHWMRPQRISHSSLH